MVLFNPGISKFLYFNTLSKTYLLSRCKALKRSHSGIVFKCFSVQNKFFVSWAIKVAARFSIAHNIKDVHLYVR